MCHFPIEEIDERPHEKRRDQCTDANDTAEQKADNDAEQIGADAQVFELAKLFIRHNQGNGIICRHTQIGCEVHGRSKAQNHDSGNQKDDPGCHARSVADDHADYIVGKLNDITKQKDIDEGGNSDIMLIKKEDGN